eukprot:sb/3467516/
MPAAGGLIKAQLDISASPQRPPIIRGSQISPYLRPVSPLFKCGSYVALWKNPQLSAISLGVCRLDKRCKLFFTPFPLYRLYLPARVLAELNLMAPSSSSATDPMKLILVELLISPQPVTLLHMAPSSSSETYPSRTANLTPAMKLILVELLISPQPVTLLHMAPSSSSETYPSRTANLTPAIELLISPQPVTLLHMAPSSSSETYPSRTANLTPASNFVTHGTELFHETYPSRTANLTPATLPVKLILVELLISPQPVTLLHMAPSSSSETYPSRTANLTPASNFVTHGTELFQ